MTTNDPPPNPGESPGSDDSTTSGLPSYGSVPPPEDTPPPPPPPPPPSAPGGSSEAFSAPDAIGYGWRKFKDNAAPLVIAALLFFVIEIILNLIGRGIGESGMGMGGGFSIGGFLWSLVSYAVTTVIGAIFARGALDVVDGGEFNLGTAFGKLNLANVIIASVIVSVLITIGFILLVVPGLVAIFLTFFTTLYVVDDASSPVDAVRDSVKLVGANVGDSLLLALLNVLVLFVGAIALGVGLLVAYPVFALASAYAYRRFRGQPVAA
jgi:uncharacterized membrane protein